MRAGWRVAIAAWAFCIELNAHVGGNPATAEQARQAVTDFLQTVFKLG